MLKKWVIILVFLGGMMKGSANPVELDITKGVCKIDHILYPLIGLGTYPLTDTICTEAVEYAAQMGYRIIDTATYYNNFEAIAKALKHKNRHDFYLISKVWPDRHSPKDLQEDLEMTLQQLGTGYLDAYLLHWPNSAIPIEETLTAMEGLRLEGKIRHIGISNATVNHLRRALEVGVPLTWVQVEMHPYFYDAELLAFCKGHGIAIQAWSPLGRGRINDDPLLAQIGNKYGKTVSQVALKWIIQHGCFPIPCSKNEKHLEENRALNDFMLTPEEMEEINQRAKQGERKRLTKERYGFSDEFEFSYEKCWPK